MADTDNRTQWDDDATGANEPSAKTDNQNKLPLAYHDNNGRPEFIGGSSVASASSISVPDNENYFVVTGTTTITAIASTTSGSSAIETGVVVWVKFTGTPSITHNATSMILPGGEDIDAKANDVYAFRHEGSGNWRMVSVSTAGPTLKDYRETLVTQGASGAAYTIDLENGNTYEVTLSANCTFTFSNPPASGTTGSFTLRLVQDSTARTVTWPASVDWPGGTAPTISTGSGEVDVFTFFTMDGGTTWYGFTAGQAMA